MAVTDDGDPAFCDVRARGKEIQRSRDVSDALNGVTALLPHTFFTSRGAKLSGARVR